jgi:hypothetical protein
VATFLDPLIALVSAHAWIAYLALFLAALLEAVPFAGAVIPGSTIILALSALVPGASYGSNRCWRTQSPAPCKHYWILSVIGGASIVALATWTIRGRKSRTMVEPTAERVRDDFR